MSSDRSDTKLETASIRDIKQLLEQLLEREREEELIRSFVPALQLAVSQDIQKVNPIYLSRAYHRFNLIRPTNSIYITQPQEQIITVLKRIEPCDRLPVLTEQIIVLLELLEPRDRLPSLTEVARRMRLGCNISLAVPEQPKMGNADEIRNGGDIPIPASPRQNACDQPTGSHYSTTSKEDTVPQEQLSGKMGESVPCSEQEWFRRTKEYISNMRKSHRSQPALLSATSAVSDTSVHNEACLRPNDGNILLILTFV